MNKEALDVLGTLLIFFQNVQTILLKISIAVDCINDEQSTHLVSRISKEALEDFMQVFDI